MWEKNELYGMDADAESYFDTIWHCLSKEAQQTATDHGFRDMPIDTKLLRIHSEISECSEAFRDGNPISKKIPPYSQAQEELADAVIRILHLGAVHDYHLAGAILAKMKYNQSRPYLHGRQQS